jgi:hypothetical protein
VPGAVGAGQPLDMAVAGEPALAPGKRPGGLRSRSLVSVRRSGMRALSPTPADGSGLTGGRFTLGRAPVSWARSTRTWSRPCGFFAPSLVHPAWGSALAAAPHGDLVAENTRPCAPWARRHLAGLPGVGRLAGPAGRVVDAADASVRALFAAWRALPSPAARAGLALLRLREHRGAGHLLAVAAGGLTPLEAILGGPGPAKAAANGWHPPYPPAASGASRRVAAAERRTDALVGTAYACLNAGERAELVALLQTAPRRATT